MYFENGKIAGTTPNVECAKCELRNDVSCTYNDDVVTHDLDAVEKMPCMKHALAAAQILGKELDAQYPSTKKG